MKTHIRSLIFLLILAAVTYAGWDKPFRDWLGYEPAKKGAPPSSTSSPSGKWMWDPQRLTPLDSPSAKSNYPQHSPEPGSWMWNPNRRSPLDPPSKSATPH